VERSGEFVSPCAALARPWHLPMTLCLFCLPDTHGEKTATVLLGPRCEVKSSLRRWRRLSCSRCSDMPRTNMHPPQVAAPALHFLCCQSPCHDQVLSMWAGRLWFVHIIPSFFFFASSPLPDLLTVGISDNLPVDHQKQTPVFTVAYNGLDAYPGHGVLVAASIVELTSSVPSNTAIPSRPWEP